MQFGHEQPDVYRVSIRYGAWAYQVAKSLKGNDGPARDQLLCASQSIPLNIAEKATGRGPMPIGAASSRSLAARRGLVLSRRLRGFARPAIKCELCSGNRSLVSCGG
jgi:hypothetical protein